MILIRTVINNFWSNLSYSIGNTDSLVVYKGHFIHKIQLVRFSTTTKVETVTNQTSTCSNCLNLVLYVDL